MQQSIQQCFRLGKDNTHTKRPIKVVFKTGHEEVRDWGKPDAIASQQGAGIPVQNSGRSYNESTEVVFELCRLPQRPSLTLHPLGGSTPRMWPLFLMRAKGKGKEMTGTLHVGTLKHQFLQYITIKNVFVLFHYQNNFEMNYSSAI
jgi:hypothetical protein